MLEIWISPPTKSLIAEIGKPKKRSLKTRNQAEFLYASYRRNCCKKSAPTGYQIMRVRDCQRLAVKKVIWHPEVFYAARTRRYLSSLAKRKYTEFRG